MTSNSKPDFLQLVRSPVLVRQLAADTLREAIVTGALKPGEKLIEANLVKRMGVSRPSIREALSQLAAEKLVTVVPNRGPSVATISWDDAAAIYDARVLIEGEVVVLFAARARAEDLATMRKALGDFKRAMSRKDMPTLVSSTAEFYAVMLEGCGNAIMTEILQGLNARIGVLRALSMSRPGRASHSFSEMTAILTALESGDAKRARDASRTHVRAAQDAARESFRQMEQPSLTA